MSLVEFLRSAISISALRVSLRVGYLRDALTAQTETQILNPSCRLSRVLKTASVKVPSTVVRIKAFKIYSPPVLVVVITDGDDLTSC